MVSSQRLCNFNTIPSPAKLEEYDEDNIQVQAGTMSKYMRRTAFFVLGIRDPNNIQGVNTDGSEVSTSDQYLEGYDIVDGVTFAVTGTKPVDQFSWIRIRHPRPCRFGVSANSKAIDHNASVP